MLYEVITMIDKPAYRLYDRNGAEIRYDAMLDHLASSAVVLFGELHIDSIVHWLQFEVIQDLFRRVGQRLIVGAEMFEADDQIIIDEYMADTIGHETLTAEAKVWKNYETDYRPRITSYNVCYTKLLRSRSCLQPVSAAGQGLGIWT